MKVSVEFGLQIPQKLGQLESQSKGEKDMFSQQVLGLLEVRHKAGI